MNETKVLYINLKREGARREYIEQHLSDRGFDFERVEAVDYKDLSPQDIAQRYDAELVRKHWTRPLAESEIACALSHLKCHQKIVDEDLAGALIVEDDALLKPEAKACFDRIKTFYKKDDNTAVFLQYHKNFSERKRRLTIDDKHSLYKIHPLWVNGFCCHGYYVTQAAAKSLLDYFQVISHPIDIWDTLVRRRIVELDALVPYVIYTKDLFESAISPTRSIAEQASFERKKSLPEKLSKLGGNIYKKLIYNVKRQPH